MDITLKQAAELAKQNVSTSRFYKDKYFQYFTTSGEGKKTKFEEKSTVELLVLIGKSYSDGLYQDQITQILDEKYGVNVVDLVKKSENNNTETTQQDIISAIKEAFREELEHRDEAILRLEDKVDALSRGYQERDRLLMENIRLLMESKKKWWRFWG